MKDAKFKRLDALDRRLLQELCSNARTPVTRLAKATGMSRDTANYRVTRFFRRGVLEGSRTLINIRSFGYEPYHVFLTLDNPESEDVLLESLHKSPYVRAVLKLDGKYDFEIAMIAKSNGEFDRLMGGILGGAKSEIRDRDLLVITDYYVDKSLPSGFLGAASRGSEVPKEPKTGHDVDRTDVRLIEAIANDCRLSACELGKRAGISADAVAYRLRKLQAAEIISKYVPVVNYTALGLGMYIILMDLDLSSAADNRKLRELARTDKNIVWAVKTMGRYNFIAYVCAKDHEDVQETIYNFRKNLAGLIRSHEMMLVDSKPKYTYFPEGLRISV